MNDRITWGLSLKDRRPLQTTRRESIDTSMVGSGSPGQGKSTLLQHLIAQLSKPYHEDGVLKMDSVVVCDLAGSKVIHNTFLDETEGRSRMVFNLDPQFETCKLNLLSLPLGKKDTLQLASGLVESLNVDTGLDYGKFYYAMRCLIFALRSLENLEKKGTPFTLESLLEIMEGLGVHFRDGDLVMNCLEMLKCFPQLSISEDDKNVLNPDDIVDPKKALCVCFTVPAIGGGLAARQIASSAMNAILMAAMARDAANLSLGRVWLLIDEAPLIMSSFASIFLANCRKHFISCALFCQASAQFQDATGKALAVVQKSCGTHVYFDTDAMEREYVSERSLDKIVRFKGGVDNTLSVVPKESWREVVVPSYSLNRLRKLGGTKQHGTIICNWGGKFSNPVDAFFPYYSKTLKDHEALRARPFPKCPAPPPVPVSVTRLAPHLAPLTDPAAQGRQKALEALHRVLLARIFPRHQSVRQVPPENQGTLRKH